MANDDRNLPSRLAPVITVAVLLVAGSLAPKGTAIDKDSLTSSRGNKARVPVQRNVAKRSEKASLRLASNVPDLSAYKDLGSWIDIYDEWPWNRPVRAVKELHRRGVRTIFLQTSNWGAKRAIFRPARTARFLEAAHRRDMQIVSWYVPSFAKKKEDYERSRAAIRFERGGHRFDSFGLDIEATVVGNVALRNRRLLDLSKRLRRLVGPDYTLGAITPDPVEADYWPNFPYKSVAQLYDVFVPMGYFSFRTHGYKGVQRYTVAGIRNIRRESGDPDVPIHLIGGIGGETRVPEVKAFVRAVTGNDVLGGSYYDMTVTSEQEWEQLEEIGNGPEPVTPTPTPTPTEAALPDIKPTPLPDINGDTAQHDKNKKSKNDKNKKSKNDKNKKSKKNDKKSGKHRKREGRKN